jgi:hypothetical protein
MTNENVKASASDFLKGTSLALNLSAMKLADADFARILTPGVMQRITAHGIEKLDISKNLKHLPGAITTIPGILPRKERNVKKAKIIGVVPPRKDKIHGLILGVENYEYRPANRNRDSAYYGVSVWCPHCRGFHFHGVPEKYGPKGIQSRSPHCADMEAPQYSIEYNFTEPAPNPKAPLGG